MRRQLHHGSAVGVLIVCTALALRAQATVVKYVYDELGRLVAVTDAAGDSAVYSYDAVGNLLSIARYTSSQVAIFDFTPNSGPVGTTVTIRGSGFNATPANNTVQFNGTAATVTTASATELVVAVPAGASTGAIGVTSPNGSANSAEDFTIAASSPPSITGFTPSIGTFNTAIVVSGTGFDQTLSSNRARVGAARAPVTAWTSGSLSILVPSGTGSGRISVATPLGESTSTADFFVPPSPYGAADVVFTDRLQPGAAASVPVSTSGKIALVVFDGTAGQRTSLKVVPGFISNVNVFRPDGVQLAGRATSFGTILIEPPLLPSAGTYTVMVDPWSSSTGTSTLTFYEVPPDLSGSVTPTPSGDSVSPNIQTPGQNAVYSFSGSVGQRISVKVSSGPAGTVLLRAPDQTPIGSANSGLLTSFIDTTVLAAAGTHTVYADPGEANTGTLTLTVYDVPADVSGSITADGSTNPVAITTPGQNGALTFTGTAGQRVFLKVGGSAPAGTVALLNPDSSTLASVNSGVTTTFIDARALVASGTHAVKVDPGTYNTGTVNLSLYDVPADSTGTIDVGGASVPLTFATGQNGTLTFAGTLNQQVTVRLTGNTIGQVAVRLKRADGTQLTAASSSASSFNLSTQTLPATEAYTIEVDPQQWNAGGITVAVTNP